jgi:DNA polymerase III sliding clamp (beta) subunit (PCNA family)
MLEIQHPEASKIKKIFEVLQKFSEEIELICDENGINAVGINSVHVCMFSMYLPKDFFSTYNVTETHSLKINSENFVKVLKLHRPKNSIILSHDEGNKLNIVMKEGEKKGKLSVNFTLTEDVEETNTLKQNLDSLKAYEMQNIFSLSPSLLESTLNAAITVSTSITVATKNVDTEAELNFKSEGSLGDIEDIIDPADLKDSEFSLNGEWVYTIEFLKDIVKSKDFSTNMKVHLGVSINPENDKIKSLPIRFDFDLENGAELNFYLAPRKSDGESNTETDEDDYADGNEDEYEETDDE